MPMPKVHVNLPKKDFLEMLRRAAEAGEVDFKDIVRIWDDPAFVVTDLGEEGARRFAESLLHEIE
jgi:hypothetical protein